MPGRITPLVTGEYYHVFNRGISNQQVFNTKRDYKRFINCTRYYQNIETSIKYSMLSEVSSIIRKNLWDEINSNQNKHCEILAYCLMASHFHFVLRQEKDNGISKFIGNTINSYTRYFNVKNERKGALFQGKFKAVHIQHDDQLLHVVRYVHLNPYSSSIVGNISDCLIYPYSSIGEYLNPSVIKYKLISSDIVLNHFKTKTEFKLFTIDQADYQKELEYIKHLLVE